METQKICNALDLNSRTSSPVNMETEYELRSTPVTSLIANPKVLTDTVSLLFRLETVHTPARVSLSVSKTVCRMAMIGGAAGVLVGMGVCEELVLKDIGWECDKQHSFLRYKSYCTDPRHYWTALKPLLHNTSHHITAFPRTSPEQRVKTSRDQE
jgi:hypothetical protein